MKLKFVNQKWFIQSSDLKTMLTKQFLRELVEDLSDTAFDYGVESALQSSKTHSRGLDFGNTTEKIHKIIDLLDLP